MKPHGNASGGRARTVVALLFLAACAAGLTALALEVLLRIALFSSWLPITSLRDPGLYADFDSDDDYWKLQLRWTGFTGIPAPALDRRIGYVTPRSPRNPFELLGPLGELPARGARDPVVLFYGDSYLASPMDDPDGRIPALLATRLATRGRVPVLNFGMGGYELDQIVLRFETTHRSFRNPRVLMGVLTGDLDRCVLSVRQGQKPRFVIDPAGRLRLTNVPIQADQHVYLRDNPPAIRSYLWRMARLRLSRSPLAEVVPVLQWDRRIPEKKAIARALLERAVAHSRRRGIPLCFVLFYTDQELNWVSWQEAFLRPTLEELAACYVDTKPALLRAVASGRIAREDLFDPRTAHHTSEANAVIAEALAQQWSVIDRPAGGPSAE